MNSKVLNNGYIKLIDHMGADDITIRAARRCWGSSSKGIESDTKLIRHLIKNEHKSPFEHMVYHFDVKTPIFVARQWFRHRLSSASEQSMRYCLAERDYYIPDGLSYLDREEWCEFNEAAYDAYDKYVRMGANKELSRSLLPQGAYTMWYWTVNGSSLMNFLKLRCDSHAQPEIQVYANEILRLVKEVAPICFGEFENIILKGNK